jgi:hypothetical protein
VYGRLRNKSNRAREGKEPVVTWWPWHKRVDNHSQGSDCSHQSDVV